MRRARARTAYGDDSKLSINVMYTCVSRQIDFFHNLLLIFCLFEAAEAFDSAVLSTCREKKLFLLCHTENSPVEIENFPSPLMLALELCVLKKYKRNKRRRKRQTFYLHNVYCLCLDRIVVFFLFFVEQVEGESTNTLSHPQLSGEYLGSTTSSKQRRLCKLSSPFLSRHHLVFCLVVNDERLKENTRPL